MHWRGHEIVLAVMVCAASLLLAGCMPAGERASTERTEPEMSQDQQLSAFVLRADAWGAEIISEIPSEDVVAVSTNGGGVRRASNQSHEWPKYYVWDQIVELSADGPRTPVDVAEDLDAWLKKQGWERNEEQELPPGRHTFERDYFRQGFHLVVEVYTDPPPHAQKITLMIVTPETDPEAN